MTPYPTIFGLSRPPNAPAFPEGTGAFTLHDALDRTYLVRWPGSSGTPLRLVVH